MANYSLFYQNTRGYHWNIQGDKFFELHLKFEEVYNDLVIKIDEVAERILTLGHTPEHRYSNYAVTSEIKESDQVTDGLEGMQLILDSLKIILAKQRIALDLAAEMNDEGPILK